MCHIFYPSDPENTDPAFARPRKGIELVSYNDTCKWIVFSLSLSLFNYMLNQETIFHGM